MESCVFCVLPTQADATVMKRLACDNGGVFHAVPDNGDLATAMSSYYKYFSCVARAHTQMSC